jgi:Flp pilus assembly protein TadG
MLRQSPDLKHLRPLWARRLRVQRLRRVSGENGAAIVEFALSAAILLSLVFGIMGLSMALYSYHFISNAAREGTRYAIVRGSACPSVLPGCPDPGTPVDVQTYLRTASYPGNGGTFPGIIPGNLTATVTFPTTGTPACTPSVNPCDNPGNLVQVTVNYQFPLNIPFVPSETLTMSSTSQMVISQ